MIFDIKQFKDQSVKKDLNIGECHGIREVKLNFSKYLYNIQNYLQIPCKASLNMCYNSSSCNHGLNFTEKKQK